MMSTAVNGKISSKFIRNCPANSSGCFSATGQYDRGDRNPNNDISKFHLMSKSNKKYLLPKEKKLGWFEKFYGNSNFHSSFTSENLFARHFILSLFSLWID
jgi:hypothetical protein